MRRYGEQKKVVVTSMEKLFKNVATFFDKMNQLISCTILKWSAQKIAGLEQSSKHLRGKWTEYSGLCSGSSIDIGGGECVHPLHPFPVVKIGTYKQSVTSENKVLVVLVEPFFESAEYAASFAKRAVKKVFLSQVSSYGLLIARLNHSLSDFCSSR